MIPVVLAAATTEKKNEEPDKWMNIANGEKGQAEIKGSKHNPRIVEYHQSTLLKASDDEEPWCSSFVNWVMRQTGYQGTNSARAISWKTWGKEMPVSKPNTGRLR